MNKKWNDLLILLDYLHKDECFTTYEIDKDKKGKAILDQCSIPWVKEMSHMKNGEEITSFTLYFGVHSEVEAYKTLTECFGGHSNGDKYKAKTCFAEGEFSPNGQYIKGSLRFSLMPWAVGKALSGGLRKINWAEDYKDYVQTATTRIENIFEEGTGYPQMQLALQQLAYLSDWVPTSFNLSAGTSNTKVNAKRHSPFLVIPNTRSKDLIKSHDESKVKEKKGDKNRGIVNSFFLSDIENVMNAAQRGDIGKALEAYLYYHKLRERVDLGNLTFLLKDWNEIEHLRKGKWPTDNSKLNLMQQTIVNLIFKELLEEGGILSVNGPPGTGKTSLLRDVFAHIVTIRAEKLALFGCPQDAFDSGTNIIVKTDREGSHGRSFTTYTFYKPNDLIIQDAIVVASSNNKAVENIIEELPCNGAIKGYVGHPKAQYFQELAQLVLNDPEAWGMICAFLGSKSKQTEFVDRFWRGHPEHKNPNTESNSMKMILQENAPIEQRTWKQAVGAFREAQRNLEQVVDNMIVWNNQLKDQREKELSQEITQLQKHYLEDKRKQLERHKSKVLNDKKLTEKKMTDLRNKRKHQPFLKKLWKWGEYSDQKKNLLETLGNLDESLNDITNLDMKIRGGIQQIEREEKEIEDKLEELKRICEAIPADFRKNVPTDSFWYLEEETTWETFQKSSPWVYDDLERARSELFLQSLALHYSFIMGARKQIRSNLNILMDYLKRDIPYSKVESFLSDLWNTLFIVVPIVSTTFASLSNMFRGVGRESIGWLVIDEAGQALPQAAVGGIWRAKRAIVVGDPQQIQPVQKTPNGLLKTLRSYYGISEDAAKALRSVQSLADWANQFGTYIKREPKTWIGIPLFVHYRCLEPMFSISNQISYEGKMVYATNEPDVCQLPPFRSQWVDVKGEVIKKHWVPEQGIEVLKLVKFAFQQINESNEVPSLHIIAPFGEVVEELKDELRKQVEELRGVVNKESFYKWIEYGVGTVHTFQGKSAQTIIFCLGLDEETKDSAKFMEEPNILNVAVTRAMHCFITIGDKNLWQKKPYFDVVLRELETAK